MTNSIDEHRRQFIEAMKRAEAISEKMVKDACAAVAAGQGNHLAAAQMAMEAHRRTKELREQTEAELSQSETKHPTKP